MAMTRATNERLLEALDVYCHPHVGPTSEPAYHDLIVLAEACHRSLTYVMSLEKDGVVPVSGVEGELRELERTLAYDMASSVLDSHCTVQYCDGSGRWLDLRTADTDVTDEVRYLHSRRLLDVHPEHAHWVSVRDEDEPLAATEGQVR